MTELTKPDRPKAGAKKQDWVNYVAAHGEDYAKAKAMTMVELQAWKPKQAEPQQDPVQDEETTVEAGGPADAPEPDWSEALGHHGPVMTLEQYEKLNPPSVHELWCRVMDSVKSVEKGDYNKDQHFRFRGVDATVDAVGPALRKAGVHIRPHKVKLIASTEYSSKSGGRMVNRIVRVTWKVTGPQGDSFKGQSMGEAADSSDKSLAKAQSVAYRVYLLQALAVPTGDPDPDSETVERATPSEREQAVRQVQSGQSYRSREEWEAAQRQAKAGEENQDRWPDSTNNDPWTGKPDEAQQDSSTVRQPDSPKAAEQSAEAAEKRKQMWRDAKALGWEWGRLSARFKSDYGIETAAATAEQLEEFRVAIIAESDDMERAKELAQRELGAREVNPDAGQLL